jgi:hypothetical protein
MSVLTLPGSPVSITFNGEEARDFIIEEAFGRPSINEFHTVENDARAKKQLAFLNRFGKLTIADPGCGTGISSETLGTAEKYWDPVETKVWIQQCQKDIIQSLLVYADAKGFSRADLNQNSIWTSFIFDLMMDAKTEDIMRMAWLSDTNYVAGNLTNGATDLPFYNIYDGFWRQILDSITAGNTTGTGAVTRAYTIAENALTTTALQLDLSSTDAKKRRALDVWQGLIEKADTRLSSNPNKIIIATKTLCDNWANYLETQGVNSSFERLESGFSRLMYRDIPIYCFDLLDRYIQADFLTGSPETYDTPHRAIMTTKENLQIGLDGLNESLQVETWYDQTTQQWNGRMLSIEDVKIIWDFMVAVAY